MNRGARLTLWPALGLALLLTGYMLMSTTLMVYDDEGFALISLRNYLAGLRLYDDIFSQYGPWPYVYHQIITLGGQVPLTHTLGRGITLLHWVAMALLCGGVTWRLARNQAAAMAATIIAFGLTWQMIAEPSHPGSHISLLVALAGWLVTLLPDASRPGRVYAALGVVTAMLLLTKINVGLLMAAGVGAFTLRHAAWPVRWRSLGWLGLAGLLALPWVLLGKQLHHSWALIFAVQFTLSAAGLLWLDPAKSPGERLGARAWVVAPVAALIVIAVVCGWVMARGTTPAALIQTVLLNPLRMPSRFTVGISWFPETWVLAAVGGLVVARAGWEIRRQRQPSRATRWLVVIFRAVIFLIFLWQIHQWSSYAGIFHFSADCLPLLPVFLVPLGGAADAGNRLARWGAAYVALPQVLHAFPVAGSQLGWATFLCVPLLVAGLWETGAAWRELAGEPGRKLARAGALALVAGSLFLLGLLGYTSCQRYFHLRPLDLPGAEDIRVGGEMRQAVRLVNLNASIHADVLFSCQGMYSHNLWSGVPTPTAQNATHWFWLLTPGQQQEIIARLAATPRSAVITCPYLDDLLVQLHVAVGGPLHEFVQERYHPLFRYGAYIFNVPLGSHAVAFGRFEALSSASSDPAVLPVLFRTNVLLNGRPASIRLQTLDFPWANGPELLAKNSRALAQPIDREGRAFGEPIPLPSAQPLRGLYQLSVFTSPLPDNLAWQNCVLNVRDAGGQLLSESVH